MGIKQSGQPPRLVAPGLTNEFPAIRNVLRSLLNPGALMASILRGSVQTRAKSRPWQGTQSPLTPIHFAQAVIVYHFSHNVVKLFLEIYLTRPGLNLEAF